MFLACSALIFLLAYLFLNPVGYNSLVQISRNHSRGDLSLSASETADMRRELSARIERDGLSKTYEYLRANLSQQGSAINHTIQHYFGGMVYDKLGFEGIKLCGYNYPNGCSHGLILKTIETEGYDTAIGKIINACKNAGDAKLSCVHILGHEFEAHYIKEGVTVALSKCKELNLGVSPDVCYSGVFMQYYFPDIYEGGSTDQMRKFDPVMAFDLCKPIKDDDFRRACTMYTTEWWQFGLNKDYSKVLSLCDKLNVYDRRNCIGSIGIMVADNFSSKYDGINSVCSIPTDKNDQLLCFAGAVKFLVSNDKKSDIEASEYICPKNPAECVTVSKTLYY